MPKKTTKKIERTAEKVVKGAINHAAQGRFEDLPKWAQDKMLEMQDLIQRLIRMRTEDED